MQGWYDGKLDIDPAAPLDASLKAAPAKWAVYLMSEQDDRPVQMLVVRNLRASLRRRLGPPDEAELSKRVDYRDVVRRVKWKRVDNPLESDLTYLDVARQVYPDSYQKIVTQRTAWWVHVDPESPHPRWIATSDPCPGCGHSFGPLAEKSHAQRLVEKLEDLFDLCRYHNVLTQTPVGLPCAYKDMRKCPAPCDGTVSMKQYKQLIEWSVRTLNDPQAEIDEQTDRMREAAADTQFETAGRIKQFVEGLKSLTAGECRFVRPAARFHFVAVVAGPGRGQAKVVEVTLAGVVERLGLVAEPTAFPDVAPPPVVKDIDTERLGLIAAHLFTPKAGSVFLPDAQWTRSALAAAYRAVVKQSAQTPAEEGEGIVKEAGSPSLK